MKRDIHNFTLDYFIKHQKKLVKKYKGKELLMDFSGVVAAFDTLREALAIGDKTIGYGKYSVMKCLPGKEAYTATICHFKSLRLNPVCLATLASIFGPISALS